MGLYIEVPQNQNKAVQMVELHGATLLDGPPENETGNLDFEAVPDGTTLLCVVQNGPFDAIGIVEDDYDLHDFADPTDLRRKNWLLIDTEKAVELQPRYQPQES